MEIISPALGGLIERAFRLLDTIKWEITVRRDDDFWRRQGFEIGIDRQWIRGNLRVADMRDVPENEVPFRQFEGYAKYRTRRLRLAVAGIQQDIGKVYLMHRRSK